MNSVFSRILPLALAVLLSTPVLVEAQKPSHAKGELLVGVKPGVSDADIERAYKRRGGQKLQKLSKIKVHRVKVSENDLEAVEAALREDPNVEFVEKNLIGEATFVPNDPGYSAQWHLPKISAPGG